MSLSGPVRYRQAVNRHDPAERMWNTLKRLAQSESGNLTQAEAVKRVKAAARTEGAFELPDRAVQFYAQEYREMVRAKQKSG